MTAWPVADLGDIPALPLRPFAGGQPKPTTDQPIPSRPGPCVFPTAVDPALAGWEPPTLDDLGLTADPVAQVIALRAQIDQLTAAMTAQQRADLAQYDQPRHLRSVA